MYEREFSGRLMCGNSSHQWELSCLSIEVSVSCILSISAAEKGRGESRYTLSGLGAPLCCICFCLSQ